MPARAPTSSTSLISDTPARHANVHHFSLVREFHSLIYAGPPAMRYTRLRRRTPCRVCDVPLSCSS